MQIDGLGCSASYEEMGLHRLGLKDDGELREAGPHLRDGDRLLGLVFGERVQNMGL